MKKNGQAALIILAIMALGMTITLSLSRRVITDVQISEQEEQSARAFSAAEAGIEEALRRIEIGEIDSVTVNPEDLGVSDVDINIAEQGGGDQFLYPTTLQPGETAIIWLRDHTDDGRLDESSGYDQTSIDLCWQNGAAIEAIYFYRATGGEYQIRHFAFDSDAASRGNNFVSTGLGSCSEIDGLNISTTLDLSDGTPLFLVVRPFYQSTQIGVVTQSGSTLPAQGYLITSSGMVERDQGNNIARRIMVFHGWNAPPPSLFHGLYGTGISGN